MGLRSNAGLGIRAGSSPGGGNIDLATETVGVLPAAKIGVHASAHQDGGSDEISVTGLSGLLGDPQKVNVLSNAVLTSTRKNLNFSTDFSVADDVGNDRANISIASTISNKTLDNTNVITVKDANLTLQDDADVTKQFKFQLSAITTGTTRTLTVPDKDGTIATLADVQASDTFIEHADTPGAFAGAGKQVVRVNAGATALEFVSTLTDLTLDNTNVVTLKDANFTLQDDVDPTKQAKFQLSGLTTATTRTYTLPDVTDELMTLTATQTATNKIFTTPTIGDFTNATHDHQNNAGGGTLDVAAIATGILGVARGGTGTGTAFTAGSIVFAGASGVYSQDNSKLFWDNSTKRLGVGTPSPEGFVHVFKASAGVVTASASANEIVIESNTNGGISFLTPTGAASNIFFGDPDDNDIGKIAYVHGSDALDFTAGAVLISRMTAAGMAVGGTTIAATALLDLTSTSKGFLAPRMTTAQRDAIGSPATGLYIYNTTTNRPEHFDGATWVSSAGATDHGLLTGLSDDDHSIYALLAGRGTGTPSQTIKGGTANADTIRLQGSSAAQPGPTELYVTHDTSQTGRLSVIDIIRDFSGLVTSNVGMGVRIRFFNKNTDQTSSNYATIIAKYNVNDGASNQNRIDFVNFNFGGFGGTEGGTPQFNWDNQGNLTARNELKWTNGVHKLRNAAGQVAEVVVNGTIAMHVTSSGIVKLGSSQFLQVSPSGLTAARTFTFPDVTDELMTLTATQTATNKTLTAPTLGGTVAGTFTIGGTPTLGANLTISDAINVVLDITTGTKFGTATTQKLAFYNSTPIVQPSSTGETVGFTAGVGTGVNDDSTFTGNVGSKAYRISDVVKHLKNLGLLAAS